MTKSATEVMESAIVAAVLDAVAALKTASGGLQNALIRDISAIHPNTTFGDLPRPVQAAITASVRSAFGALQKEGYTVAPSRGTPPPVAPRPQNAGPRGGGRPSPKPPTVETRRRRGPPPGGGAPKPPKPRGG
jgi:hypothetical protein